MIIYLLLAISIIQPRLTESVTYTGQSIDSEMAVIKEALKGEEKELKSLMTPLIPKIKTTMDVFNALNITYSEQNIIYYLISILKELVWLLEDLSNTISYKERINETSCENVNVKEAEINFNIRYFGHISGIAWSNNTRLTGLNSWVAYNTLISFKILKSNKTQLKMINSIISTVSKINMEYYNYILLLDEAVIEETDISNHLIEFKTQFCICPTDACNAFAAVTDLFDEVDDLEAPLIQNENNLIDLAKTILNYSLVLFANYPSASLEFPYVIEYVIRIQIFTENFITTSSFYNVTWNNLTTCADLSDRIGFMRTKYFQNLQAWYSSFRNLSLSSDLLLIGKMTGGIELGCPECKILNFTNPIANKIFTLNIKLRDFSSTFGYLTSRVWHLWSEMFDLSNRYCSCTTDARFVTQKSTSITPKPTKLGQNMTNTGPSIDSELDLVISQLKDEETELNNMIMTLDATIPSVLSVLISIKDQIEKSSDDVIIELHSSLEDLRKEISYFDNFGNYNHKTTCVNANMKETELNFNIEHFGRISERIFLYKTKFEGLNSIVAYNLQQSNEVLKQKNVTGLRQQKLVASIIADANRIIEEFKNYNLMLNNATENGKIIKTHLDLFKNQFCVCSTDVTNVVSNATSLKKFVNDFEQQGKRREENLKNTTKICLNNLNPVLNWMMKSNESVPVEFRIQINRVRNILGNITTADSFNIGTKKNITTCQDLNTEISNIWVKSKHFDQATESGYYNYSNAQRTFNRITHGYIYSQNITFSYMYDKFGKCMKNLLNSLFNSGSDFEYNSKIINQKLSEVMSMSGNFCNCSTISGAKKIN